MKRLPLLLLTAAIGVIVSCSNPAASLPPVTQADSQKAITAMSDVQSAGYSGWGSCTVSYGTNTITATCPYFTLTITFYPSMSPFPTPSGASHAVMTETITNYPDATTGYTISGTLNFTINYSNASPTTLVYTGNLNFSGTGNVRTMTMNLTYNMLATSYTGTATVNGQTFTY